MLADWIKHRVVTSPLRRPAELLRDLSTAPKRIRHPHLRDIFLEGARSRQVIASTVTDGMNCVDVGCHLGSVLGEFVALSPTGSHVAVEPLPYKAAWLRRAFPQVKIVEAAVSDSPGQVEFTWNRTRSGFSSLAGGGVNGSDGAEMIVVDSTPLDELTPPDRRVGFLKVDVEGAELMAFRSAPRIMTSDRPVVLFECARRSTEALGFQVDQVFELLTKDYGYIVMYLHEYLTTRTPLDLDAFKQSMVYPFKAFNFVAVPR